MGMLLKQTNRQTSSRTISWTTRQTFFWVQMLALTLVSTPGFGNQTCGDFLRKFKPVGKLAPRFMIETPALNALPNLLRRLEGSETQMLYRPDWKVAFDQDGIGYLDFSFISETLPPAEMNPTVQVLAPSEKKPHLHTLLVRLGRDQNGEFTDWDLLDRSLEYLSAFAQAEDEFEWVINDLGLLKKLHSTFETALREIDYTGRLPEFPEAESLSRKPTGDLVWVEMSATDIEEVMERLDDEGIKKRLLDSLEDSLFGRSFESNVSWQMRVFPRVVGSENGFILRFVLELKPLF